MNSVSAFFSQGGYGFFVWSSYVVTFVLLALEIVQLRRQSRTILARLGRLVRVRAPGGGGNS